MICGADAGARELEQPQVRSSHVHVFGFGCDGPHSGKFGEHLTTIVRLKYVEILPVRPGGCTTNVLW